eukprot:gene23406-30333_t
MATIVFHNSFFDTIPDLNNVGSRPPSSKKGKEAAPAPAAKKGKVDPNLPPPIVAFREPVLSSILPRDSMRSLPSVIKPDEGQSTPKDKKPPSKAKVEQVLALDPFDEIEKSTMELVLKSYSRGTFTANRQLYGKDESLCVVVEHAVWFEVEKLKVFMDKVRQSLDQQVHFLEKMDKSLLHVLYDVIKLRFKKEIAANNVLYTIIQRAIDNATELEELWQVTPDANPINPRKFREEALKRFRDQLPAHLRQTEEEKKRHKNGIARLNLHENGGGEGVLTTRSSSGKLRRKSGHSLDGSVGSSLDNDGDEESDSDQDTNESNNIFINNTILEEAPGGVLLQVFEIRVCLLDSLIEQILRVRVVERTDYLYPFDYKERHMGSSTAPTSLQPISLVGCSLRLSRKPFPIHSNVLKDAINGLTVSSLGRRPKEDLRQGYVIYHVNSFLVLLLGYLYSDSSDDSRSRPSSSRTAATVKSLSAAIPSSMGTVAAVAAIRKNASKLRRQSTASQAVDAEERERFKKEMAKYIAAKKRLEDKLEKRRHAREEEFRGLGMSPAMAKLAAQNDLFLDEQHKMEDFDLINKPKHHHGGGGGSKPNSARPRGRRK